MDQTPAADGESTPSILADPEETGGIFNLERYLSQLEKLVDEISAPIGLETGIITIESTGADDGLGTPDLTPDSLPETVPVQTPESDSDAFNVKELYYYIPGDVLNFREKGNFGVPFAEIYKKDCSNDQQSDVRNTHAKH